ncbi:hypothetical protein FGG08_003559 [Glutinoglossum americanum]|uniref:Transmembrane protein n=1 Tax=Glutinoglossum americanum TaxID=1670608 RepID=A0A9P8I2A6_9PEZI|nr:hypothetical protein FGG08_003559 [Glutinoglossum americanum]
MAYPSTTRVSIVNTSANFLFSALLGLVIFSEALPPLWWLGAALLVVGNFFVGKRDGDGEKVKEENEEEEEGEEEDDDDGEVREDVPLLVRRDADGEEEEEGKEDDDEEGVDNIPPPVR